MKAICDVSCHGMLLNARKKVRMISSHSKKITTKCSHPHLLISSYTDVCETNRMKKASQRDTTTLCFKQLRRAKYKIKKANYSSMCQRDIFEQYE